MESIPEVPPLTELVAALEQATLMAKQLPSTTDPTHVLQFCSSLQNAHHQITTFISKFHSSQQPQAGENSVSSAVGEGEPMQVGDDDDDEAIEEEKSHFIIDKVEERMKNCVIQNKRRKRPLSPSSIAVDQRVWNDNGLSVQGFSEFDPLATRLRSLDLIYQFHG